MSDAVLTALEWQARGCARLGAPFYAGMLARVIADTAGGGPTAQLFAPWADASPEKAQTDAVALRLLAAWNYLALSSDAADLAKRFPPRAFDVDGAWAAARTALATHDGLIRRFMAHEPQTNEVRRSACLLGGFLRIAQDTKLPLRCFEIGASAGLNSLWDRFHYRIGDAALGDAEWGDVESPVTLDSRWEGAAPSLEPQVRILERRACDRRPVDIREPDEALRLLSYVWPEQIERQARLRAAIAVARSSGVAVEAGDASVWARQATPVQGAATVVFHSIVMQYMPAAEQAAFRQVLETHGAAATRQAPFAWLRMEPDKAATTFELRLTLWPDGADQLLAEVHPHGEFAVWR
jgi:hypothetical protein